MTFEEVLTQAITMLQRIERVSYRALKRQFDLDDDYLDDLKEELIEIQQCARDQDGRMLVWIGEPLLFKGRDFPRTDIATVPLAGDTDTPTEGQGE